ncbi:MAG: RNA polymerase factor sigma-54 [Puniceicoccales bacterium]|nr:RNA polymerase factor sigma-54 [Puniceicoccales bacterium]
MVQRMEQIQTQSQLLAPQLRQSLKILQVSAMDLRNVILEELQMNPTLEELPLDEVSLDDPVNAEDRWEDYNEFAPDSKANAIAHSRKHDFLMNSLASEISLQDHLYEQVGFLDISHEVESVVRFLIGSIDEKGFLTLPLHKIEEQTKADAETIQVAIATLKQLDPPGIGCDGPRTCLLQQLKIRKKSSSIAFQILDQCYDLLLRNKVIDIARYLSVSCDTVQSAIEEIAKLDPAPGRRFEVHHVQGIIPDVAIYKNHLHEWVVDLNNHYIPRLCIGNTYEHLLSDTSINHQDKNYLRLKIRSGRFLIRSILHRQKTIERIAYALLDKQKDFFEAGPKHLKPLTLQSLAEDLSIHETTVSRAIANKFMKTSFGIFDFRYFFTKGLNSDSGDSIANTIIKQQIQKVIEQEDKKKPLSDQKIVEILAQKNVKIARRTVTKYREILCIPPTSLRRKYDAYEYS